MAELNPKMVQAQKEGKVDYSCIPWRIMYLLAQAMEEGAEKYGRFNYREDSIEARTYIAAICRHLFGDPSSDSVGWVNGEDIDPGSDLPHLIKVMACCLLVEDAKFHNKLIDNRLAQESKTPPAERDEENAFSKSDWFLGTEQLKCYQCEQACLYLFADARCKNCTRLIPAEVQG